MVCYILHATLIESIYSILYTIINILYEKGMLYIGWRCEQIKGVVI